MSEVKKPRPDLGVEVKLFVYRDRDGEYRVSVTATDALGTVIPRNTYQGACKVHAAIHRAKVKLVEEMFRLEVEER